MKEITFFFKRGCPYCRKADRSITELMAGNPEYAKVPFRRIDEDDLPEDLEGSYDYYYVPTMFVGDEKIFEAHPGQEYEEIREEVRRVFERAIGE